MQMDPAYSGPSMLAEHMRKSLTKEATPLSGSVDLNVNVKSPKGTTATVKNNTRVFEPIRTNRVQQQPETDNGSAAYGEE
jgi:hypothetical protein